MPSDVQIISEIIVVLLLLVAIGHTIKELWSSDNSGEIEYLENVEN